MVLKLLWILFCLDMNPNRFFLNRYFRIRSKICLFLKEMSEFVGKSDKSPLEGFVSIYNSVQLYFSKELHNIFSY